MTAMRSIFAVARRDFWQRARNKMLLIATAVVVVAILGVGLLMAAGVEDQQTIDIGHVGTPPAALPAVMDAVAEHFDLAYELHEFESREATEAALVEGDIAVAIDGRTVVWQQETSSLTNAMVTTALQELERQDIIEALGLSSDEVTQLLSPAPPAVETLEEPDPERAVRQGAAYAGTLVLFMSILMLGQFVLLGVLEEKSNRVAEVVLSRVRPIELMAGKVIGIGVLGLAQLLVFAAAALALVSIIDLAELPNLSEVGVSVILGVVGWFVLGYAFYAVLYAAAGSLVSRQEDVQGVGWIPLILLMPAYLLALSAMANPDLAIVRVGSMLPALAPLVMPARYAVAPGDTALWEVGVAILVTVASTYLVILFAARVYRGGILSTRRAKLRDAYRGTSL
jgi:ABC-2 type transport system permease protein